MNRTVIILLLLAGCSTPRGEPYTGPTTLNPTEGVLREPSDEEIEELVELAELVLVGRVGERKEDPAGVTYRVEVVEILHETPAARANEAYPHAVGSEITVSSFLYRPGEAMRRLRRLKEPNRYIFWLSPMEREGAWLNLDDAAGYPLPDADGTLRKLRTRWEAAREKEAATRGK
jgi:hypothetical protein